MSKKIAVIGYASMDYIVNVDSVPKPGRTTTIFERAAAHWPRLGGSPCFVAVAIATCSSHSAFPVTWIGSDAAGCNMKEQLEEAGVRTEGVAAAGEQTPIAMVAYEPEGGCMVLYHPTIRDDLDLTDAQREVITLSDWLCITIGPARATGQALDLLPDHAGMCWVVKDDPRAMSTALAARLAMRADVIIHNASEAGFVQKTLVNTAVSRSNRIVIETKGGDGAMLAVGGQAQFVPSEALVVADPTGAGDTFAGGVLASLAAGSSDPVAVIRAGHAAARALLVSRAGSI